MRDYILIDNQFVFNRKKIDKRLIQSNDYFSLIIYLLIIVFALFGIHNSFKTESVFYWLFMSLFTFLLIALIIGFYKDSIAEMIFENINIVTSFQFVENKIIIIYYNTMSMEQNQIVINKNDFTLYEVNIIRVIKTIHQEVDYYFPFSSFKDEYVFKKYFDFKLPIVEIDEPKRKKRFIFF